MCVLGLYFVNTAVAKIIIKCIMFSFHHVPIHITNYKICSARTDGLTRLEEGLHNWSGQTYPEHYLIKCMGGQ